MLILSCGVRVFGATCWNLVWSDEFNGTSINTANWGYDTGCNAFGNNEWENYTNSPTNSYVSGGHLVINAVQTGTGQCGYTSARLTTYNKVHYTYGRIEASIKMPYGQGIWPAFWMLGENINTSPWPACGELDIMEMIGGGSGKDNVCYGTAHWADSGGAHTMSGSSTSVAWPAKLSDSYHVYAIEWDAAQLRWYFDGVQYYSVNTNGTSMEEFTGRDFYIIFNLAVGGTWPGYPDGTTVLPQQMLVDYVRWYQQGACPATPTFTASRTASPAFTSTRTLTFTATRTQTPSATGTYTRTPTPTSTRTNTINITSTFTVTPTSTPTRTQTPANTMTFTATYSRTATRSASASATASVSPSNTYTRTATASVSPSPSYTETRTPTYSQTPVNSFTFTQTATPTSTRTATFTSTYTRVNTLTFTPTITQTATRTSTPTLTASPANTFTSTMLPTGSITVSPTGTGTAVPSPSATASVPPQLTFTITQTQTSQVPSVTASPSLTATSTITPSFTVVPPSITNTRTYTPTRTTTPSFTLTRTTTPSYTETIYQSPTQTPTAILSSPTITLTATLTSSNVPTTSASVTQISTATYSRTVTNTPTASVTNTESRVPSFTGTQTMIPDTLTPTPTDTQPTIPDTPTQTPTTTHYPPPTPTPTDTRFTITDPLIYPCPYTGDGDLHVKFNLSQDCRSVSFRLYTVSLRYVLKSSVTGALSGNTEMDIKRDRISSLATGTYYYIITAKKADGTEVNSKAGALIIIK